MQNALLSNAYFSFRIFPPEFFEIRYGDFASSPVLPIRAVYFDRQSMFVVVKVCARMSGTVSTPLTPSLFPDMTKNHTGELFYYKSTEDVTFLLIRFKYFGHEQTPKSTICFLKSLGAV